MSAKILCPFCGDEIVSDVIDSNKEVDGEWQCNNGHTFIVKWIHRIINGKVGEYHI